MAEMVREYLAEPYKLQATSPLSYLAMKEVIWPDLSTMVQRLLSCPPMNLQRFFPHVSDMVSSHHSCPLPWTAETVGIPEGQLATVWLPGLGL